MHGLPDNWTTDAAETYAGQLRGLAHSWGLHDDDENQQEIALRLLEQDARPGSRYDPGKGSWRSHCYTVGRQCLARMVRKRRNLTATQELRTMAIEDLERRTNRTIEEEQERRYEQHRPFRGTASVAA